MKTLFFWFCVSEMPASLEISDKADELEIGRLTEVGFLMINIAYTYSKPSREIPHLS